MGETRELDYPNWYSAANERIFQMVVPAWPFMLKHITLKSALIFDDDDFVEVIQMMAEGKFTGYEKLVTGRIKVEEVVEKGFKELIHHKDQHIKILVSPNI